MPGKVKVKHRKEFNPVSNEHVYYSAPSWVLEALKRLSPALAGTVIEFPNGQVHRIGNPMTLQDLFFLTCNESQNVTGLINWQLYEGIDAKIVLTLKDLMREVKIVGYVSATAYGGYLPRSNPKVQLSQPQARLVCSAIGLQAQRPENTMRLFLVAPSQNPLPSGIYDNEIFNAITGMDRCQKYDDALADTKRFVPVNLTYTLGTTVPYFFDFVAYQESIANDFVNDALMLDFAAQHVNAPRMRFKFLQQGTGAFARERIFSSAIGWIDNDNAALIPILQQHIGIGILKGLQKLFSQYTVPRITTIELPFFPDKVGDNANILRQIIELCRKNNVQCITSTNDALKPGDDPTEIVGVTNNADPHAPAGNEMTYDSVDAAIALNLTCVGNSLSLYANGSAKCVAFPSPARSAQLSAAPAPSVMHAPAPHAAPAQAVPAPQAPMALALTLSQQQQLGAALRTLAAQPQSKDSDWYAIELTIDGYLYLSPKTLGRIDTFCAENRYEHNPRHKAGTAFDASNPYQRLDLPVDKIKLDLEFFLCSKEFSSLNKYFDFSKHSFEPSSYTVPLRAEVAQHIQLHVQEIVNVLLSSCEVFSAREQRRPFKAVEAVACGSLSANQDSYRKLLGNDTAGSTLLSKEEKETIATLTTLSREKPAVLQRALSYAVNTHLGSTSYLRQYDIYLDEAGDLRLGYRIINTISSICEYRSNSPQHTSPGYRSLSAGQQMLANLKYVLTGNFDNLIQYFEENAIVFVDNSYYFIPLKQELKQGEVLLKATDMLEVWQSIDAQLRKIAGTLLEQKEMEAWAQETTQRVNLPVVEVPADIMGKFEYLSQMIADNLDENGVTSIAGLKDGYLYFSPAVIYALKAHLSQPGNDDIAFFISQKPSYKEKIKAAFLAYATMLQKTGWFNVDSLHLLPNGFFVIPITDVFLSAIYHNASSVTKTLIEGLREFFKEISCEITVEPKPQQYPYETHVSSQAATLFHHFIEVTRGKKAVSDPYPDSVSGTSFSSSLNRFFKTAMPIFTLKEYPGQNRFTICFVNKKTQEHFLAHFSEYIRMASSQQGLASALALSKQTEEGGRAVKEMRSLDTEQSARTKMLAATMENLSLQESHQPSYLRDAKDRYDEYLVLTNDPKRSKDPAQPIDARLAFMLYFEVKDTNVNLSIDSECQLYILEMVLSDAGFQKLDATLEGRSSYLQENFTMLEVMQKHKQPRTQNVTCSSLMFQPEQSVQSEQIKSTMDHGTTYLKLCLPHNLLMDLFRFTAFEVSAQHLGGKFHGDKAAAVGVLPPGFGVSIPHLQIEPATPANLMLPAAAPSCSAGNSSDELSTLAAAKEAWALARVKQFGRTTLANGYVSLVIPQTQVDHLFAAYKIHMGFTKANSPANELALKRSFESSDRARQFLLVLLDRDCCGYSSDLTSAIRATVDPRLNVVLIGPKEKIDDAQMEISCFVNARYAKKQEEISKAASQTLALPCSDRSVMEDLARQERLKEKCKEDLPTIRDLLVEIIEGKAQGSQSNIIVCPVITTPGQLLLICPIQGQDDAGAQEIAESIKTGLAIADIICEIKPTGHAGYRSLRAEFSVDTLAKLNQSKDAIKQALIKSKSQAPTPAMAAPAAATSLYPSLTTAGLTQQGAGLFSRAPGAPAAPATHPSSQQQGWRRS